MAPVASTLIALIPFNRHTDKDLLMSKNSSAPVGRHFLQIRGDVLPTGVLRAMDTPMIDHRGPECAKSPRMPRGHQDHFQNHEPGHHLDATGTGAWKRARHTLSPATAADGRDRPVCDAVEDHAEKLSLKPEFIKTDWPHRRRPPAIEEHCAPTRARRSRAVCDTAQRDLDRLPLAHTRVRKGDRRRRPPARFSSTPSPRSPRPTTARRVGSSTSPSAARRRG